MIEHEKKILLTANEYANLVSGISDTALHIIQTNYYYDTDDFTMNSEDVTCRVRENNGEYTATIKKHGSCGLDGSDEKVIDISKSLKINVFNNMGLQLQGALITKRTIVYKDKFCHVMIDCNTYLGFTDYELEIEYLDGCEQQAMALISYIAGILRLKDKNFKTNQFVLRAISTESKSQRFFRRKLQLKENFLK